MKLFPILAILLCCIAFAAYIPFFGLAMVLGLFLLGAGTLLGTAMHTGWKKLSGKV